MKTGKSNSGHCLNFKSAKKNKGGLKENGFNYMKYKTEKNYWQQDIPPSEYVRASLQGILLILGVSYLFYGTLWGAIPLSFYLIWYLKSWKKQQMQKRKSAFQIQFKDAITAVSAALNVGYSTENSLKEAYKDLQLLYKKDERILKEFRYMLHQLEINIPVEKILAELSDRTGEEDVESFVTVFSMAKRSGGDMIAIIRNAVYQIGEKIEVKREIDTMMTAKKLEFRLMSAIPFGMICYLKLSFPEFMSVLYGSLPGICIMTGCLALYFGSYVLGKRIVEVEV